MWITSKALDTTREIRERRDDISQSNIDLGLAILCLPVPLAEIAARSVLAPLRLYPAAKCSA
ncbi:MAG TPA: hypothetical protein DEF05_09080 [Erwinia sp.]|nr:hypothetical protein [Erwinia sp.]